MKWRGFRGFISVILLISVALGGCIKGEKSMVKIPPEVASHSDNPKYIFSSFYSHEGVELEGNAMDYSLPLSEDDIKNLDILQERLNLSADAVEVLKKNGFVVVDYGKTEDITKIYQDMRTRGIPIFVTPDTFLHIYHIHFNEILKNIEERDFFDSLVKITEKLYETSLSDYSTFTDERMKEASRRNVAYFAVALHLLGKKVDVPSYAEKMVDREISNIAAHEGFATSSIFHYEEDYSQYVPRGHYTQSEKLQRYFMAMMWYGRMAFLLKGGEGAIITEEDASIATSQACLISSHLSSISIEGENAFDMWKRMYAITSFFVGLSDDLTPYEYLEKMLELFGENFSISIFSDDRNIEAMQEALLALRPPSIYGGTGNYGISPPFTKEKMMDLLNKTRGMRFMGQRYVPDSYIFQQLVSPSVGMYDGDEDKKPFTMEITMGGAARCFPRGLDLMAVFGSERALQILEEEGDTSYSGINTSYIKQMEMLREKFDAMNVSEWNRNLYWSWLYSLKALLGDFDNAYPSFMRSEAWKDRELCTALASWSELRHDTILYAKQSYTPRLTSVPAPTPGYVEPVIEFYLRMEALVNMTLKGLKEMNAINETEEANLRSLQGIIGRMAEISAKELEGKEMSDDDYTFLTNFVEKINSTLYGMSKEAKTTLMVADVHTDANTMQCLEEGVGYVKAIIVAYPTSHGIYAGVGPMLSYYEFKQPVSNRLTDEEWKEMVDSISPPEWTSSFTI